MVMRRTHRATSAPTTSPPASFVLPSIRIGKEYARLQALADEAGQTLSQFIRGRLF